MTGLRSQQRIPSNPPVSPARQPRNFSTAFRPSFAFAVIRCLPFHSSDRSIDLAASRDLSVCSGIQSRDSSARNSARRIEVHPEVAAGYSLRSQKSGSGVPLVESDQFQQQKHWRVRISPPLVGSPRLNQVCEQGVEVEHE